MAEARIRVNELLEIRQTMAKAQALLAEATRRLDTALTPQAVDYAVGDTVPSGSVLAGLDAPLRLDDLDLRVIHGVVEALPAVFDTYHVVEHDQFRTAHAMLLSHPAINQLTGKALRRNAAVLGLDYVGQRGRRRSALWRKEPAPEER